MIDCKFGLKATITDSHSGWLHRNIKKTVAVGCSIGFLACLLKSDTQIYHHKRHISLFGLVGDTESN